MKPINTSTFDFPTLIQRGFVYVDKTRQIYELVRQDTDSIYFFSRPRRFGKSLLISTLKALFRGRREMFKGLAIEKTGWDWKREVYPVLHLDMSDAACSNADVFEFKFGKSAKAAIKQCREKNYANFFTGDRRPVYYVGVNYSPRKNIRTVNDVVCEKAWTTDQDGLQLPSRYAAGSVGRHAAQTAYSPTQLGNL